jgi:hypothetical protein
MLTTKRQLVNGLYTHDTDCKSSSLSGLFGWKIIFPIVLQVTLKENQTVESIQAAKTKVRKEIRDLKDRLRNIQENIHVLKEKVESEENLIDD